MLRPLLYVSVLIAGAVTQTHAAYSEHDISSCPITYFGQKYEKIYVSITNENLAICFNDFFNNRIKGDCLIGPQPTASKVAFEIQQNSDLEEEIYKKVPNVVTKLECQVVVSEEGSMMPAYVLANFGQQAVFVIIRPSYGRNNFYALAKGLIVSRLRIARTLENQQDYTFVDLTGCRYSGRVYKAGQPVLFDDGCNQVICDQAGALQNDCGPLERCQDNMCRLYYGTCTVTGPAVIDIHGHVNSVEDRCAYSLVSTALFPGFHILANFRERRRKDVSFVDSVTLRLSEPRVLIHLDQGGRVRLDNTTLNINSTVEVYGVELSKDRLGVTAKLSIINLILSVFFDGYTAQIQVEGPGASYLGGLCGDSSRSLDEVRLSEHSSTGCETLYSDTADSTINCNKVTERCNLLKEAPFFGCHIYVDPNPYIAACTNTLCKYPMLDGLNCQFLKAYARACSLRSSNILEGWWSTVSCSPPEAFCQNKTCSAHEFCGEKTVGCETHCYCRPIFASKYRLTGALGDSTICKDNTASVSLVGCLLEEKDIDYSALHLNDQTCRGQLDEQTHMVTFSFNSRNPCGMVVTSTENKIIYKNTITSQNSSSDAIFRQNQVCIDFSCFLMQPDIKTVAFKVKDSSEIQITSGAWIYNLSMTAYTDAGCKRAVDSSTEVLLNQQIWVKLDTEGLDPDLVTAVTESCWATNQPSPTATPRYTLIKNGCADDWTVNIKGNGLGTSNSFSFKMFHFSKFSGEVYLHCKLQLCVKQDGNCAPVCSRGPERRRRSVPSSYEAPALISMTWTD